MMIDLYILVLSSMFAFALGGWLISLLTKKVSHVDNLWGLFFLIASFTCALNIEHLTNRHLILISLITIWSLRLSLYLIYRNWSKEEDSRYQKIKVNNEPNFKYKSIYIIFGLQAIWASIIVLPIISSFTDVRIIKLNDQIGFFIISLGIIYETLADYQLNKFLSGGTKKVMQTGLWKYSRHPNYFGEFLVWWGFYIVSIGGGNILTIVSPILMTFLLLKYTGVGLMEQTIGHRRPDYENYINKTSSFIPWPPKK